MASRRPKMLPRRPKMRPRDLPRGPQEATIYDFHCFFADFGVLASSASSRSKTAQKALNIAPIRPTR
eukprot:1685831-Pyramimonas_sp.AAC.1